MGLLWENRSAAALFVWMQGGCEWYSVAIDEFLGQRKVLFMRKPSKYSGVIVFLEGAVGIIWLCGEHVQRIVVAQMFGAGFPKSELQYQHMERDVFMFYNGIELELPAGAVVFSHSHALDTIRGKSGAQNVEWVDRLADVPWGKLKEALPGNYEDAGRLFSLVSMNYQVCNGGIFQYFDNHYHVARDANSEHDVERYDLDTQKKTFAEYVEFAEAVYPERVSENQALADACAAFQKLWLEEDAEIVETVYCDEDEYIWDDELEEEVENPDYFEEYDEVSYEDVIHGDDGFDDIFHEANAYFEEIIELRAQLCCKELVRAAEREWLDPVLREELKGIFPGNGSCLPSLDAQIEDAEATVSAVAHDSVALGQDIER